MQNGGITGWVHELSGPLWTRPKTTFSVLLQQGVSSVSTLYFPSIQCQQGSYASDLGLFRYSLILNE